MKKYDVIIIGGGASGMMAAIHAAKRGKKTAIIEQKERLGKKILATGNGKCNYTNLYQEIECYRGSDPKIAMDIVSQFDQQKTIAFFQSIGVYPKVRNGYVYPYSEQAASVADVLSMECKNQGVEVFLSEKVVKVKKQQDFFYITSETNQYLATSIIIAAGGCAAPKQGSDGSGFAIAKALGHQIVTPFPALVQLKTVEKFGKLVSGVRCEAKARLVSKIKEIASEQGEFLFTDYGISGIPILQMSRYAVELVDKKEVVNLYLDFFPNLSNQELSAMLKERMEHNSQRTIEESLIGLINNKLAYLIIREAKLSMDLTCKYIKEKDILRLVDLCKNFALTINGSNGFDQAQVSAGGVNLTEVNPHTLESKLVIGLYFTGEVLDVDGTCGGYNLQWAWSSGVLAGNSVR
jgi:predicted Rossmann fold flavoprotein